MPLDKKDLELIEHIVYKNSDDIAISISRSFERLEERIDAAESRIYSRLSEVEDRVESSRQEQSDLIGNIRDDIRELLHLHEDAELD